MKSKLLCLLLLITSATIAQINVSESFETSFPTGWTTTGQSAGFSRGIYSSSCDQSYSMIAGLYSSNNHAMIVTSNYVSDGNSIIASFDYNRTGSASGNVYLYYDVNNVNSWQQIATSADLSPGCKTLRGAIPGNLVPAGSNVRFRMQINSTSNISVYIDNFKAEQKPFAFEYTFDNTRSNTDGLFPFGSANTVFVADRNGTANAAMQINANVSGSQNVIPLLPTGNTPRSFSLWYKTNSNLNANVFTYGTNCQNCNFGTYLGANGNPVFQSYISDTDFGGNYAVNTWHHIVVTYNGNLVKMYMNGVLIGSQIYNLVTGSNFAFRLGGNTSTLTVDDLRMFERAITDAEVSNLYNHNQIENPTPPVISAISETPTASTVTVNYTLTTANGSATSLIKYGLSDTTLNSQITGFSTNTTATNGVTINGLLPSTTYYYQIEATNIDGTTSSSIENFTTLAGQTIAEYSFDNTYNNLLGNSPFTSNSGSSFVNDRNGNPNAAINLTNAGIEASIPTLPFNGSSRTICLWAKLNTMQSYNHTFSYGGIFTGLGFAGSFNETAVDFFGYSDDFNVPSANAVSTWYHFVYTYDGVNVKVYKNGVLLGSTPKNLNTAVYDIFSLGRGLDYSSIFSGAIDDLKIYNYAVSDTEVSNLYNYNSLATEGFTLESNKIKLYPNPANDILNIETSLEVQSVEIYTIQGQKVASSTEKQINVSHLASGIYLVKTQDSNNKISTDKIIIQ
jgi:hypothetical protein